MKKSFSLIELIFAIVIIGIIASFAIPKYLNTKSKAEVSTIKRDVSTISTSIQVYYLSNQNITKITDAVVVNSTYWDISDKKVTYKDGSNDCLSLEIKTDDGTYLQQTITVSAGTTCVELSNSGITTQRFDLF